MDEIAYMLALSDRTRLQIVKNLIGGQKSCSELAKILGIPAINVSHHTGVLFAAGVIRKLTSGRYIMCELTNFTVTEDSLTLNGPNISIRLVQK